MFPIRPLNAAMQALYGELDKRVAKKIAYDKAEAGREPSCKKGCDSCCKIMTICTIAEALVMAHALRQKPDWRELLPALRESALQMAPIGLSEHDYAQKRLPCVFLRDGACSMYDSRPAACRYYFVISPAVLCDADTTELVTSLDTIKEKAEVMGASASMFGPAGYACAPLPLMVLNALRMLAQKPAEAAALDAALFGLPDPIAWCDAKVRESFPDEEGLMDHVATRMATQNR